MSPLQKRLLAAVLSGLGLALTSPPYGHAWLAWMVWVPMFWACRPGEGKRNAAIAYLAGIVSTAVIYEWLIGTVQLFGHLPWAVGLLVLLLFAAIFSLVYPLVFGTVHWFRARLGDYWMLATPALWVSFEKLDPSLFPYYQGSTQYRTEATWQFASVLGPTGLSFLIVLCNCILAESLYRRSEQRPAPRKPLMAMAILLIGIVGWGGWRVNAVEAALQEAPVVQIGLIQQDVTMDERLTAGSPIPALTDWMSQTVDVAPQAPDLVIWAEGAIPFDASVGGEDPDVVPAFCNLTVEEYFELMAGHGGPAILMDSLNRSLCQDARNWASRQAIERARAEAPDLAVSQCGYDMLIGAGSRADDRTFNTAFAVSRPPLDCRYCPQASACENSTETVVEPKDTVAAQLAVLGCTTQHAEDPDARAACLEEQGLELGSLQGGYDKMIPLPFGEYVPLSDVFPSLRGSLEGVGDFKAGTEVKIFSGTTSDGTAYTYSVPICYEAILERQMWKMFQVENQEPVDFFVNITNDAWYGVTAGPHQHAMLTAAQAMMFGRPLIRSAYTGVSWIVEPHGRILYETGLYENSAKVHPMRLGSVDTLFVRGGWVFPYLCLVGTFLAFVIGRRRGTNVDNSSSESTPSVTPDESST